MIDAQLESTMTAQLGPVFLLFIIVALGLLCAIIFTGSYEALPMVVIPIVGLCFLVFIMPAILGTMNEMSGWQEADAPNAAREDVPDINWSGVWSVVSWILFGLGVIAGIGLLVKLAQWTKRATIWFVSPPPAWLCRWLNRPLPPVIRPLTTTQTSDHSIYVVPDDPIFVEIDRALDAADRMLQEDRLS